MASKATIQLNYRRAINQANKLENLADELRRIAKNNLDSTISDLSNNWKGESASAFLQKAQKAYEDILKNADQLDKTASVIKRSAENVRNSELRALEIATAREAFNKAFK